MKEKLEDLLKKKYETSTLDFKREIKISSDKDKEEFARDVSAFANTKGGCIVYGKEDPKEGERIVGIKPETFNYDQMQQIVSKRCNPPVKFEASLMHLDSKWFALLRIPESSLKPHEIIRTREVRIRRGSITDNASTQETMQMSEKSKRKLELEETQPSEETLLVEYKEKATMFGVLLLYILCYLPIRVWSFWAQEKGLGLTNWVSFEALVYPFIILTIISILTYVFGYNLMKAIMRFLRKISVPYLVSLSVVVLAVLILNLMIFLYPESTRFFFFNAWQDFLVICALSLAIALIAIVLSYFPILQYFAKLKNPEYRANPAKEMRQLRSIGDAQNNSL